MKIERVEAVSRTIKSQTLSTSYGAAVSERVHAFVRVTTDTGLVGIGEASPLPHFTGEVGEAIAAIVDERFGPALVKARVDPFHLERIHRVLDETLPHHTTAKHALVAAMYDILGKSIGRPSADLLGGRLHDAFPTVRAIGIGDVDATVAAALHAVASGVTTLKIKIGVTPAEDIHTVAEVRRAVGEDVAIRVDANQRYDVKEAIQLIRDLEPLNVQYVEQPVPADDPDAIARVTRSTGVRVAADESVYGSAQALALLRRRAVDVFVVKLIKTGGMYRGRQLLAMAEAANIPCVLVSPYETSIGTAANLHVASAARNIPFALEVGVFDIPDEPAAGIEMKDGLIRVPLSPGLGVDVDEELFSSDK